MQPNYWRMFTLCLLANILYSAMGIDIFIQLLLGIPTGYLVGAYEHYLNQRK